LILTCKNNLKILKIEFKLKKNILKKNTFKIQKQLNFKKIEVNIQVRCRG
jgi:hypothetical protein